MRQEVAGDERSLIVIIRQKELELADRLTAAQQAAERALVEARRQAAEQRDQAERDACVAAGAFERAELDAVDAEAECIRADGELEAARLAENGVLAMEQAVQRILDAVMPALPSG